MVKELFKEGGPHNIKKTGFNRYKFEIPIPKDERDKRIGRECPNKECSPGYFKVSLGTGITSEQKIAYCPYCRFQEHPNNFATEEQKRFGEDTITREVLEAGANMIKNAFGLDSSNKKRLSDGFVTIDMDYKEGSRPSIKRPFEEELLRSVICPNCGLDHAVFGLAIWCPACGKDIFLTHVYAEFIVIRSILGDVDRRRKELGPRVASRDIENCLEDVVSVFEAVLKSILTRYLHIKGEIEENIQNILIKKIRNSFQNPSKAIEIIREHMQQSLFENCSSSDVEFVKNTFEKRHPITHNLGIIDRKYIENTMDAEKEGKEIRVAQQEIFDTIEIIYNAISDLYLKVFQIN